MATSLEKLEKFSWSSPVFPIPQESFFAMATNFMLYRTCSLGAEVYQDPLDWFSGPLHRMVGIELQMINPTFFFRYLKGRCQGNQFSGKMGQNYLPPALIALSFRNGIGYRYFNECVNRANDASISCKNFVKLRQPCVNSHWLSQWEALGTRYIWPPTESTYLNRSLNNLSQVIMSTTSTAVQNLVEIRPWGASGQIGEILTIFRFFIYTLFKQLTYRSDHSPHFHA